MKDEPHFGSARQEPRLASTLVVLERKVAGGVVLRVTREQDICLEIDWSKAADVPRVDQLRHLLNFFSHDWQRMRRPYHSLLGCAHDFELRTNSEPNQEECRMKHFVP